jgi:hypothetical protein
MRHRQRNVERQTTTRNTDRRMLRDKQLHETQTENVEQYLYRLGEQSCSCTGSSRPHYCTRSNTDSSSSSCNPVHTGQGYTLSGGSLCVVLTETLYNYVLLTHSCIASIKFDATKILTIVSKLSRKSFLFIKCLKRKRIWRKVEVLHNLKTKMFVHKNKCKENYNFFSELTYRHV